jgi:hypothetical protein
MRLAPGEDIRGVYEVSSSGDFAMMYRALLRAIEITCGPTVDMAISDAYVHLIGDCITDECELCEEIGGEKEED